FAAGNLPLLAAAAAERVDSRHLLRSMYFFSFPYYVVAATVTAFYAAIQPFVQWYATALLVPMMVLLHRSLARYAQQVDNHRAKAADTAALQERTMEALALAMEKDQTTQRHLQRMKIYAAGIGKDLGLTKTELAALEAAAVLHDVGKL